MRKFIFFLLVICSIATTLSGCQLNDNNSLELVQLNYEEIKDKLVRFHVIANSDTDEDQALKLKVRDEVIDALSNELKDAKTLEEAKQLLKDNIETVNEVARRVINENNFSYNVNTMLSHENFPDKVYGNYIFPQGNYEAFRVIIGEGNGQNWWCVMFPPLCFVDESKNSVDSEKLKYNIEEATSENKNNNNEIEDNKTNDDYEEDATEIENSEVTKNIDDEKATDNIKSKSKKVVFKSKILEFIMNLFN